MIEGDSSASFELAYLKYDGNDYENIFAEKINQFVNWLTPESLSLFSMPLREKLTQMHQKYGSLAEFQGIGVDIITSPPKFCRQRVRFAVREVSNLEISNYKILGQRCNDAPTSLIIVNLFHALDDSLSLNISDYGSTKEKKFYYVMWESGSPSVLVEEFPIASEHISAVMPIILAVADRYIIFGENLQAVHYLSSTIGDLIITFIYDAPLHDSWELFITEFQRQLLLQLQNIETFPTFRKLILVGRSKNVKVVIGGESFIQERLTVTTRNGTTQDFFYKQVDEGFSNPNTHVNMKVLNWLYSIISENIRPKEDEDLLEMYCGNANHTVVLSNLFRKVLAVEINEKLVEIGKENLEFNGATNVHILACDSAKMAQQVLGKTVYVYDPKKQNKTKKIKQKGTESKEEDTSELVRYEFKTVLVDPPRMGLDDRTLKAVQQYDNIIYISCYPPKLLENITKLRETHEVTRIGMFDHFAYTNHLEVGVLLQRKKS